MTAAERRIRDATIIDLRLHYASVQDLALCFDLTRARVSQIVQAAGLAQPRGRPPCWRSCSDR